MYISKFSAFNFRSLKQVVVRFEKGRNVLVGKNNSGKSNIIKGIEILLGEKFPSYINFTDSDFYTYELVDQDTGEIVEKPSDDFYLEVELEGRDFNEALIKTIKKQTAFSQVKNSNCLYTKEKDGSIRINYDFFQSLDEIENRDEVAVLDTFANGAPKKTVWRKPDDLIAFLKSLRKLKLFFCKSRTDDEKSGLGFICIDANGNFWVTHFLSKKLKDSIVTTTVIGALRSQKEDLRIVHYSWFGKLVLGLWNNNKLLVNTDNGKTYEEMIIENSIGIKELVDTIFHKDTSEIRKLLEGAIAHKSISFRFISDSAKELYKNIQLFVNDGIDRPLNEKGTGIQSAIIISLFSLYCNKFHNNSSLLIAEEPELFLHPQARRVISAELDKFLENNEQQPRQLIISTHSIEYLKNVDPLNITRVFKDRETNSSLVKQLDLATSNQISLELKRFLWSNNTELFFADKVVLVEGGEVYLIPSLVDNVRASKQLLDYENISVSRVNGKGSFLTYVKMLQCFEIPFIVLGDMDCFKDEVPKLVTHLGLTDIKELVSQIKAAMAEMPIDYGKVTDRVKNVDKNFDAQLLQIVFEKFQKSEIRQDDEELSKIILYMQSRYTDGDKEESILNKVGKENYIKVHSVLRNNGIFIWSQGDLESCYSLFSKQIEGGKDIKALQLSYLLQEEGRKISDLFINVEEISELVNLIVGAPLDAAPGLVANP